ncbi:MAG: agenet domain-containing protein [Anaerolineaceae bacterium]|jgi:hypothetical protein
MPAGRFMRAPETEKSYEVGDRVEVSCDHDHKGQRIHGWLRGTVVQVENKMLAVQFKTDIFLTDGWMVPDRILWFTFDSKNIRPIPTRGRKTTN